MARVTLGGQSVELEHEVVAVRPDKGEPSVELLSPHPHQALPEELRDRLARERIFCGSFRNVESVVALVIGIRIR
jgi:hypothetical protein